MRLLLDTHTLLWFVEGATELSARARELIEDADNDVVVSMVSYWEIVIKTHKGKLSLPSPAPDWFAQSVLPFAFRLIDVERRDIEALHRLGAPVDHADPFDRLLIASAIDRRLTLVTRDSNFGAYEVAVVW